MKQMITLAIAAFLFTGCATFQDPVDDAYLKEMTQQDKDTLAKIGNDIIAKKAEKDTAEKGLAVSEQKIVVTRTQIKTLNSQKELLVEKDKLYNIANDNAQLANVRKSTKETDEHIVQYESYEKYCEVKRDVDKAMFDVKAAELAVLVARLDFEKAKIAREFQIRQGVTEDNLINTKKYEEYMIQQQKDVADAQADYKKATDALLVADNNLSKTGFGGQK
jgi:hypothetical protein